MLEEVAAVGWWPFDSFSNTHTHTNTTHTLIQYVISTNISWTLHTVFNGKDTRPDFFFFFLKISPLPLFFFFATSEIQPIFYCIRFSKTLLGLCVNSFTLLNVAMALNCTCVCGCLWLCERNESVCVCVLSMFIPLFCLLLNSEVCV